LAREILLPKSSVKTSIDTWFFDEDACDCGVRNGLLDVDGVDRSGGGTAGVPQSDVERRESTDRIRPCKKLNRHFQMVENNPEM
jgi:hypothetical protein